MKSIDGTRLNQGRTGLMGLILGVVAVGVEGLVISPILGDISREFVVDATQTAWAVAVYGLALALIAPPIGLWGGKFSRRAVMTVGLIVFVVSGLLCAAATNFAMFVGARALCGAAAGAFLPSCYAYVGDSTPYENRGQVMGWVMAGWSIALILGVPVGSVAGEFLGWRGAFVGVSVLGAVAAFLVMGLPNVASSNNPGSSIAKDALAVIRSAVPVLLLVNFLDMVSFYGVYTYLGMVVRARLGLGSSAFGIFVLCYGMGLLVGTMNARLLDKWGKERIAACALALLVVVFIALPGATSNHGFLAVCMVLWGMLQGLSQTGIAALITQAGRRATGVATACMSCTTYLAVAIGAMAGGSLLEAYGFTALSWAAAMCVIFSSGILIRNERAIARPVPPQFD